MRKDYGVECNFARPDPLFLPAGSWIVHTKATGYPVILEMLPHVLNYFSINREIAGFKFDSDSFLRTTTIRKSSSYVFGTACFYGWHEFTL